MVQRPRVEAEVLAPVPVPVLGVVAAGAVADDRVEAAGTERVLECLIARQEWVLVAGVDPQPGAAVGARGQLRGLDDVVAVEVGGVVEGPVGGLDALSQIAGEWPPIAQNRCGERRAMS